MEGAAYTWLYKNDSQWLYKTLPSAIPREERSKINKTTFNRKK